jgi:hypothetical protein
VAGLKRLIDEDLAMWAKGRSLMAIRDVVRARGHQISHNLVANTIARHAAAGECGT